MLYLNVIGDSQFVRFNKYCRTTPTQLEIHTTVAESGATIGQVRDYIKHHRPNACKFRPCAIFLGTNDLKLDSSSFDIKRQYQSLLKLIRKVYEPSLMVIVTLPSYARYMQSQQVLDKISSVNEFLATLSRPKSTIVLNWPKVTPRSFFTPKYYNGRVDLIHLSNIGMHYLESQMVQAIIAHSEA